MEHQTFNSILIVVSLAMLSILAYASYKQNETRLLQQSKWDQTCRDVANGKDFIAQDGGCYIKWSKS